MSHAKVINGNVVEVGGLPASARRLDTQEWVLGLPDAPAEIARACGFLPVVEIAAPLGVNQHHGAPTYTVRADDVLATFPAEADDAATVNERTIRSRIAAALTANKTFIDAAKPSTAAAQASAAYDQAKALTRQVNGLLRIADNRLESAD